MWNLRTVLATALVFISVAGNARAQANSGMEAFAAEVVRRNPTLKARSLQRNGQQLEARAAGLWPDPELAVMVDRVPEDPMGEMPMVRYQLTQMIPWPGKLRLMEEALLRRRDGLGALAKAREIELVRQAKQAYLMLLLNRGLREVNTAARGLVETIANTAVARYGTGVGGHHEVARAEVEKSALDVERLALEGERTSTIAMMNALRDFPPDAAIPDPPAPSYDPAERLPALAELNRLALAQRPELEQMRFMQEEEATMARLARRERYPDFMTSVWYNQMIGGADTFGVMVGATIPIFNVSRQNRLAGAAELRASSAALDADGMRAMVRFEVADALRRVDTATRSLELIQSVAGPRAQQSLVSSLAGYSTGSVEIVGVLEAWRALQQIERARVDAMVARQLALVDLERAVGGRIQGRR